MRVFEYHDQGGKFQITEDELISEYFYWWASRLRAADKADLISRENCITDFCVVHWASEITEENRPKK